MPMAIDLSIFVTVSPREDRIISVRSENFPDQIIFDLDDPAAEPRRHWSDYVRGVAVTLKRAGFQLQGADLQIRSDLPVGAGLSSSAALEVATALALLETSGLAIDRTMLAEVCQRAENEFVGTRCGIMDQFVVSHARNGTALLLDCRSLAHALLPLPENIRFVLCNTMVRHQLAESEYNRRRSECEEGIARLVTKLPQLRALRDLTLVDLDKHGRDLPEAIFRRCRHVVTENARVLAARDVLANGDLTSFGQLMNESHYSLRDDYQVSCAELDLMAELGRQLPGVYGARMTGAGFGGCTVNLVEAEACSEFTELIARKYEAATGVAPETYVCSAVQGAGEIPETH